MRSHAIRIGLVVAVAGAALWAGVGVASAGGGCHATGASVGRGNTVDLSGLCFDSTVLYVEPGTDVTWTNRDATAHNVVGVADAWGDPGLTLHEGDTVSYRFDEDGVFPYACWIHPGMIGAIVVGDGVGTELAGVVPGTTTEAGDTALADAATAPLVQDSGAGIVIWIVGGALLLAGLAGAFALTARGRRKGTVVAG